MIKLKLRIDGEEKEFTAPGITCATTIEAYKLAGRIEAVKDAMPDDMIEEIIQFIVKAFGGQFTKEEFMTGCECSFFWIGPQLVQSVMTEVGDRLRVFPPTAAQGTQTETT